MIGFNVGFELKNPLQTYVHQIESAGAELILDCEDATSRLWILRLEGGSDIPIIESASQPPVLIFRALGAKRFAPVRRLLSRIDAAELYQTPSKMTLLGRVNHWLYRRSFGGD